MTTSKYLFIVSLYMYSSHSADTHFSCTLRVLGEAQFSINFYCTLPTVATY